MRLAFVEIVGFRGFKQKARFEFEPGFAVLTGRNGVGKSSVFDAIDFALTGSINKYQVKGAKGGGLESHIWWIGDGTPAEQYVSVGFADKAGRLITIRRSRESGLETPLDDIATALCTSMNHADDWAQTLMQTSLIRDETIATLSLDLSEQARFTAVQAAMGGLKGSDHSERTKAIAKAAEVVKAQQEARVVSAQADLGRGLSALTEVQSLATNSVEIVQAERLITSVLGDTTLSVDQLRTIIAERRQSMALLQQAILDAEKIQADIARYASVEYQNEIRQLASDIDVLESDRTDALEKAKAAQSLLDSEIEHNAGTVHLAGLLEHGTAVGLVDGHCPLCTAPQSQEHFSAALTAISSFLAERGQRIQSIAVTLAEAKGQLINAEKGLDVLRSRYTVLDTAQAATTEKQKELANTFTKWGISSALLNPDELRAQTLQRQEKTAILEQALSIMETSTALDRLSVSQSRVVNLRLQSESEKAKLNSSERAYELARQIEKASKVVANELLAEQFDTVLPLLKELYLRLRPHSEWREIETDIAGHVRASLNFTVGEGKNPQFLFSSGQRRAAGIAFLLAIHLSRPWCAFQTLLLDDPVQHIDDYRALNLVEVLSAIRKTGRQVIVAVEDGALADLLCRRLRSAVADGGKRFDMGIASDGSSTIAIDAHIPSLPFGIMEIADAS